MLSRGLVSTSRASVARARAPARQQRATTSRRASIVRRTAARATNDDDKASSSQDVPDDEPTPAVGDTDVNSALGDVISSPLFYVTFGVAGGVGLVRALGENASFLLSAAPVVLLTVISKTSFGESLMKNIDDQRPALVAEKARRENERARARERSSLYGARRVKFLGDAEYEYPAHLDGSLCGDAGFDPLGLGKDDLPRMRELELLHARWAMLGIVGVAVPELLERYGVADLGEPVWWKVGAAKLDGEARRSFSFVPDRAFRHVSDPRAPASRHASSAHFLSPYFLVRPAVVELRRPRWVRHRGEARRRRHRRVSGRVDGRAGVRAVRRHTKPRAGGRVLARRRELPGGSAVRSVRIVRCVLYKSFSPIVRFQHLIASPVN